MRWGKSRIDGTGLMRAITLLLLHWTQGCPNGQARVGNRHLGLPGWGDLAAIDFLEFLMTPLAQLVIWTSVLLILTTIGIYIVRRFRGGTEDNETSSMLLTKFRDSRYRGDLNESEFRTIKTILAERMQAEVKRENDST